MNIYEKLQKCRVALQEMNLKKSGNNKFSNYNYYQLDDFLPQVNKLFLENKLFSNFSIKEQAELVIIDIEKPEDSIVFISPIEELELKGCNKVQALGGVHTYLKRYLYVNALEIVEHDILDGLKPKANNKPKNENKTQNDTYITLKQKDELRAILGASEFASLMNTNNGKITVTQYEEIMQRG